MKFASGLVLAAVAVTAANAGNPNYLRKTEDESSHHEDDNSVLLTRNPSSGKELTPDDLTIDLTEILGESTDSSHLKINILDLIGSGSDQVDLEDIIDAFKDSAGSEDMDWLDEAGQEDEDGDHTHMKGEYKDNSFFNKGHHAGGADLSWLDDFKDESGSIDYDDKKSDAKKAFDPKDDDDSSSDDLSWLDEDSVTGSADVDDVGGAKGDSKGTSEYGKGKGPVSGSVGMAWYYGNTGSDAAGAKGANKGAASIVSDSDPVAEKGASKGSFAYGKVKEDDNDDMAWLFDDSGSVDVDAKDATKEAGLYDDDKSPVVAKSATKGAGLYDEDEEPVASKNATKATGLFDEEHEPTVSNSATKGAFAYGKGKEDDSDDMAWLFEDSGSYVVGAKDATKGAGLYDDDEPPVASKSATKGAGLYDDDEPTASKSATKGAGFNDEDEEPVAEKNATKALGLFDEDEEPVVSKSATKGAGIYDEDEDHVGEKGATKSSKSSKKGAASSSPVPLYDDGSKGRIGGEGLDEDKNPFIIAGATKGKASSVADNNDKGSLPDEDSADEVVQSGDDAEDDNIATKGSKQALP